MLILHLESPNRGRQGDHVYRTLQPCRALGELEDVTVVSGSLLTPAVQGLLDLADVLVLCDVVDADFLPVIDARRRRGRLSVYEINDHFLAPQPWSATAYLASNLISRSLSSQLARQADCLQVTVGALEQRFGHLNSRRAVFPNQLWEAPSRVRAPAGERVRVGWGGSFGHREDLGWIVPVLREVLGRHPEVTLSIMGDPSFRDLLGWAAPEQLEFTPGGDIDAYRAFVSRLTVGLAPLLPTEFNRCRSDVKFLEYAAAGALAICSDLEPYRDTIRPGENGALFASLPQLASALERALTHADERATITTTARRQVCAERIERDHAHNRLEFYRSMASLLGFDRRPGETPSLTGQAAGSDRPARQFDGSRYFAFGEGETEGLLYEGLMLQQGGRPQEARRCFAEATRRTPDFYLTHLFLAGVEAGGADALRALQRAQQLNPRSCNAAFLIGAHHQGAGETPLAVRAFERCRDIAPAFGAAQARLGELAEAAGQTETACRLYEEAALENSYLAHPVARLALIALRDGRVDKAVGLLERTLQHDADLWLTNFLVGRGYIELKRFQQARVHLLRALVTAEDRPAVLAQLAKAEIGLGNMDAARAALDEIKRLAAPPPRSQ